MAMHQGTQKKQAGFHQAGLLAGMGDGFSHNTVRTYNYIRRQDAILVILWTGLPITTATASKWLNNLIHDDNKCITANGQMIIYVGANYICHVTIIQFAQKVYGKHQDIVIYGYGFRQFHMIR